MRRELCVCVSALPIDARVAHLRNIHTLLMVVVGGGVGVCVCGYGRVAAV